MGYNIVVYCRCFEEGKSSEPPVPRKHIRRDNEEGDLYRVGLPPSTLEEDIEFDAWCLHSCEHVNGALFEGHLGNAATVGHFRACLKNYSRKKYPSLWEMFVENTHGNYQSEENLNALEELSRFRNSSDFDEYCEYTANTLEAALKTAVSKELPIYIS